jgi:ferredoxin-NADP reductase
MSAAEASSNGVASPDEVASPMPDEDLLIGEPPAYVLVRSIRQVARDILEFELGDPDGRSLPAWEPGAHIDLVLPSRRVRSYSLCSDPGDLSTYRVAVLREQASRGGSDELHDAVVEGTQLGLFGPRNHFELIDAPAYLFLAGGIGITPMLAMIAAVDRRGSPWTCVYGGRTRESMAFVDELAVYGSDRVEILVEADVGPPDIAARFRDLARGTIVYCCGPRGMIAAAESTSWRIGTSSLRVERFHPLRVPVSLHEFGSPFSVRLEREGVVLEVPSDRSLLSVIRDVLPTYPSSCGSGSCGVCEARVLSGRIDHRDRVLSLQECERGDVMMVCVSRAEGDLLVLDV